MDTLTQLNCYLCGFDCGKIGLIDYCIIILLYELLKVSQLTVIIILIVNMLSKPVCLFLLQFKSNL